MIAIVDYGLGNLGSVANMLRKIGVEGRVTADHAQLREARGLILPGVGHFDEGMRRLRQGGLDRVLTEQVVERRTPILGICLGVQLLGRRSEEGDEPGLGLVEADVKRFTFPAGKNLPIPHMGWNEVEATEDVLFQDPPSAPPRYYFVHSYHLVCDDDTHVAAWTTYGYRFAAAIHHAHIFGAQFHPEKSHKFGMSLLRSWARVVANAA